MHFPTRHISIRVPWHDSGWDGSVCRAPLENSSCLILKNVGLSRNDELELELAGKLWDHLPEEHRPACSTERGAFMAPFPLVERKAHPYAEMAPATHGHLKPTTLYHPAYAAAAIPYYWMLRDNTSELCGELGLPYDEDREPQIAKWAETWIQHGDNQQALLDGFFRHIRPHESLCFFYAKQTPLTDDPRRIIVGIGKVKSVAPARSYEMNAGGEFHSMIWDRPIEHSIRSNSVDGFLLPYHQALRLAKTLPDYDVSALALLAPEGKQREFSYVSELVSDDTAIAVLHEASRIVNVARADLEGPWDHIEAWLGDELARLWKLRGNYPGLGSILTAFGIRLGHLVSWQLQPHIDTDRPLENLLNELFDRPSAFLTSPLDEAIEPTLRKTWKHLDSGKRRAISLLARFSLNTTQASRALNSGCDIEADPYALVAMSRHWDDAISCGTIDHAFFTAGLTNQSTSELLAEPITGPLDERRIKAYAESLLENAADEGHSLLPQSELIARLNATTAIPALSVHKDILNAVQDGWQNAIDVVDVSPDPCGYQLRRLSKTRKVIVNAVTARTGKSSKRHVLPQAWPGQVVGGNTITPEQRTALHELYQSRFSVLLGPAGSGKTTLLSALCAEPSISQSGILALAPTGKARVRLQEVLRTPDALTIAQLLSQHDRFDWTTGEYRLSERPGYDGASTVIVDEASMLTEEMLAALLECTQRAKRIILVGDPNQLPPIGTGRPFFDIASHLRDSSLPGYAELKTQHRQIGSERPDLQMADAFRSGSEALDDSTALGHPQGSVHFRFEQWEHENDLEALLIRVLCEELALQNDADQRGFDKSLGGNDGFFNRSTASADQWQFLCPNRIGAFGSIRMNRLIHERFRREKLGFATRPFWQRRTLEPIGSEKIVYGDKVIANQNRKRDAYPEGGLSYVSNGEVGIVTGPFSKAPGKKLYPAIKVAFSSQPLFDYSFPKWEFTDNTNSLPPLELAYSLTIHKAQGSQYKVVIVIIPEPCQLLSRELLYTAFTRQIDRLVVLHQGSLSQIRRYQSDRYSELARRLTNLFVSPQVRLIDKVPYEDRLIHVSRRGEPMRSKSEVIIADNLAAQGIDYSYEKPLVLDGVTRWPDFTIERADTGQTFYWEHCGLLTDPGYASRWKRKEGWYRMNGILPQAEGEGPNGSLIVTQDDANGGISSKHVGELVSEIFG